MAWSNAARAAAAAMRKAHAHTRSQYTGSSRLMTTHDISTTSKQYRKHLAATIRKHRSGLGVHPMALSPTHAGRVAAKSTFYRNALRRR